MSDDFKSYRWAVLCRSENKRDGVRESLKDMPYLLFRTKLDCKNYINDTYWFIRNNPDLRAEPYGWKMPIPVRVSVEIKVLP